MSSHQSKFQATLNMIQTVPRVAESASQLHDDVMLCQLIAGARFGEDAAQDPELVFRLLDHLTERMESYEESLIAPPGEPTRVEHDALTPANVWGAPGAFVTEGESYEQHEEARIAGAPVEQPVATLGEEDVSADALAVAP